MNRTFITNINKCRPPNNRVPTTEEMGLQTYLLEQIRLVDPKIILLTGATAVKGLIGDKRGITKIRGTRVGRAFMYADSPPSLPAATLPVKQAAPNG